MNGCLTKIIYMPIEHLTCLRFSTKKKHSLKTSFMHTSSNLIQEEHRNIFFCFLIKRYL